MSYLPKPCRHLTLVELVKAGNRRFEIAVQQIDGAAKARCALRAGGLQMVFGLPRVLSLMDPAWYLRGLKTVLLVVHSGRQADIPS